MVAQRPAAARAAAARNSRDGVFDKAASITKAAEPNYYLTNHIYGQAAGIFEANEMLASAGRPETGLRETGGLAGRQAAVAAEASRIPAADRAA